MKNFLVPLLSIAFFSVVIFSGCKQNRKEVFHIGFSQCAKDEWRETMNKEMVMTASLYPDIELTILNADGNTKRQEHQIRQFLNQKVDLLIISPNESKPITPIAEEAYLSGIPTIIIDRKINSDLYTAYIGADNYQIGKDVASYIANIFKGKGRILEIRGRDGSSPALERHRGFIEILKHFPELKITESVEGMWLPDVAAQKSQIAFKNNSFDIVFGHNDVMAQSAKKVAESLSIENLFVVGIDALPNLGMELVEQGILHASFIYPTGGKKAIEIARNILIGQPFQKQNILGTSVVDSSNVTVLRLQTDQVLAFQDILNHQTKRIQEQEKQFDNQRSLLHVALISLFLLIVLSLWLAYYYYMLHKRNEELSQKNIAIERQKKQLQSQNRQIRQMNLEVKRASQAKLNFFTNISHEFRTPLTLIQAPLNEILSTPEIERNQAIKYNLLLVKQNSDRLLRLINQLMDFRKMDSGKLKLNISKVNLFQFIQDIYKAFIPLARQKNIDFSFNCSQQNVEVWMDVDKIDKVLFNVLSNAFKFTSENGIIKITAYIQEDNNVRVEVSDTGCGIPANKKQRIFEPFYQQKEHLSTGTGIGLSLSKSFIKLHKGQITVRDNYPKGSIFTIIFPKGEEYKKLDEEEKIRNLDKIDLPAVSQQDEVTKSLVVYNSTNKPFLLIVEDDEPLKSYLLSLLSPYYNIKTASNGNLALKIISEKHPDLILTDIMMPVMNGIELTSQLKNNLETSHIPIIMLTAKVEQDQKTEGIEIGADAYIEKPFDPKYLKVRIKKLIEGRETLKKYYQQNIINLDIGTINESISPIDQKFLSKLHRTLEENFSDPNFSVEKLSAIMGLSRIHLYRKMKALTNYTPTDYIGKFRLYKALKKLKDQKCNISGIALDVGFTSPAYFTKKFKEEFGQTPSDIINH
ncbi:hybrid sensor histidine kinase/response regulator transcription factor [Thermophagus sp. OGC60D27]|uniref:hybrid sensor histidine kinase/response regulator transcription factor n=1 Tax=Thermophagus sp. OGC60D27 TaxID=3458415 RepID=UPI004037645F